MQGLLRHPATAAAPWPRRARPSPSLSSGGAALSMNTKASSRPAGRCPAKACPPPLAYYVHPATLIEASLLVPRRLRV
jgi:hypothetical protein